MANPPTAEILKAVQRQGVVPMPADPPRHRSCRPSFALQGRLGPLMTAVKSTAADSRLRSALLWTLMSTIAGRSSGLVFAVVLSRMLGKESFGSFSIIQSTVLTMGVFAGFGTGLTATKHIAESFRSDTGRAGRILALTRLLALAFGFLITLTLVAGAP